MRDLTAGRGAVSVLVLLTREGARDIPFRARATMSVTLVWE